MADIHKRLAKHYLEDQGFVVAYDVAYLAESESASVPEPLDILAVKIESGKVAETVVGLVRGWWHAGANLTPSLIRLHLETDRKLLSGALADNRIAEVLARFGLQTSPVRKILFFSRRSPQKAEEAEALLGKMGFSVVYLEDVIIQILPRRYREGAVTDDDLMAVMQATKQAQFSRKKTEDNEEKAAKEKKGKEKSPIIERRGKAAQEKREIQMDFLTKLLKE